MIENSIYNACENLTQFGVTICYPQELYIEAIDVDRAISDMKIIARWAETCLKSFGETT